MELDYQNSFVYTEDDKIYLDMLAAGKVSFPGMVTGIYSMEDVAQKYMDLSMEGRKSHLKALIDPSL